MTEQQKDPSQQIYTVANVITIIRLLAVPFAFSVLVSGNNDLLAFVLFAGAAASDFVDGQIARRTNTITEVGAIIDPLVDRFLIAAGLVGLYAVHRLPLWILVVLIARDAWLLYGSARVRSLNLPRVEVIFLGKLTTAVLLTGFAGLILNAPKVDGLNITDVSWLPGFNAQPVSIWFWIIYVGMMLSIITMFMYMEIARKLAKAAKSEATH